MKDHTMTIDPAMFKEALARWASGVTVVTTLDADGKPKGMTASSFISVSLEPPLVLVSVAQRLYTHKLIEQSGIFAVNILGRDQAEWGKLFAGMYPEIENRFKKTGYDTEATGAPILPNVVDCRLYDAYRAGDHTLFLGEVQAAGSHSGEPLLYAQRQWGTFQPLPEEK